MAIIPGTTIEYENKKHDEITSAYSYAPYVTCWNNYELGINNNPVIRWSYPNEIIVTTEGSSEVYSDIVWIYDENNAYLQEGVLINAQVSDTLPVITKLDLQKYKLVIDNFTTTNATPTGVSTVNNTRNPGYTLQANEYIKNITYHWIDRAETESPQDRIKPVLRVIVDGEVWYFYINGLFETYIRNIPNGGNKLDATNPYGSNMPHDASITLFHSPAASSFTIPMPSLGHSFFCGGNTDYAVVFENPSNSTNLLYSLASSVDCMLRIIATLGVYFEYNDTMYLGFMDESGQTTGEYLTSDKYNTSAQYQSDNINNYSEHTPPYVPPVPPGYDDDPWSGVTFSGVGVGGAGAFAKCYYMTSTELANLRSWMNSNNVPEGFDPMQQIIGLSQVPVSLSGDDNTTVQFVNSSAIYDPGVTRVVDSGVNTQISMGTPIKYSLGSVDITRRMQERGEPYLDYDCQIELYLPLIGMFSLDTQAVMGRTITAEAVLDPISGTLAAYAYVAKDGQNLPIAYGSTTIGVDLPISAQQYSVSRAALKQANAQLGASILSSTLSFIAAATAGGKGSGMGAKTATGTNNGLAAAGIREAGADYMKASQVGNIFGDFMNWGRTVRQLSYGNNTAIAGSFGGSTAQWAYPFTPYVKIIRPRYEKPANYNHSQGVPCVQTKTIGSCTGFIQCLGVDVSGISGATDLELQAIQAALSNGIYAGGSQS